MDQKKVAIIGSGFAGMSAAAFLSKAGMDVTVIEKNDQVGGRARQFSEKGYTFDMGPSWYWMPEIFESFFNQFNHEISDFYTLVKLNPGFKIIYQNTELSIPADFNDTCELFENLENNGKEKLINFMKDAKIKYQIGLNFLYRSPGLSFLELLHQDLITNISKLTLLSSYSNHVRSFFKNPLLIHLLEFPVLFLGATANKMPALYSLMAYSGIKQGTFYPMGGFHKIIEGMYTICKNLGLKFHTNEYVSKININKKIVESIKTNKRVINTDILIASADYAHVEKDLLPKKFRNYSLKYWEKKQFSPSSLIFYLGINKKIKKLEHHTLFFDEDIEKNSDDIYKYKKCNSKPLFYVCCPSKTDNNVAPKGKENIFILMPIAAGLNDTEEIRKQYFELIINRIEKYTEENIHDHIEYKKSYCIKDFEIDYNAYKGNAYGLANTIMQTANLKPKIKNKKIQNLYYSGQLTVPGPGVPPSIISGEIVSKLILKNKC